MTERRINRLNWFGTWGAGQGYSGSSEQYCLALERLGIEVFTVQMNKTIRANVSEEGLDLMGKKFKLCDLAICYNFPNAFSSMFRNKFRVGFTMFETSKLPDPHTDWTGDYDSVAEAINNNVDLLLVPSKHNVELFRKHGVTVPIEVVHVGIRPDTYSLVKRPTRSTFTFLMTGTLTIRKNSGNVISAFIDLFKDKPDARLIIKTQSGTHGAIEFNPKTCGNIQIIDAPYTEQRMKELMRDADAFVFPSRGEGFGMPPLEAMATGLPTIIAGNTGMLEYADERYNYVVKPDGESPALRYPTKWGDVGNWYESDFDDLKAKMLEVYTNRDEAKKKGELASKWVLERFSYDRIVREQLLPAIEKHYKGL